jgi:hypothetical protein
MKRESPGLSYGGAQKAEVLLKAARAKSGDEATRASLIEAARTIKSDQERGRVLSTIFN